MEKIKEILKRIGEMGGIAVVALYEVEEATAEIKTMETQLKDKDERIKELEAARKGYFTVLNDKLNRNNFLEINYEKYRKTVAMLFWGWREYKRRGKNWEDEAETFKIAFYKAYAILKDNA